MEPNLIKVRITTQNRHQYIHRRKFIFTMTLKSWIILLHIEFVLGLCDNAANLFDNKCMDVVLGSLTFAEAKAECQKNITNSVGQQFQGLSLTSLPDSNSNSRAETVISNSAQATSLSTEDDVWIGGKEKSRTVVWKDIDGEILSQQGCHSLLSGASLPAATTISDITPSLCLTECASHQYMALKNPNLCYCLPSMEDYFIPERRSVCSACTADSSKRCGEGSYYEVYKINGTYSQWEFSQPSASFSYSFCGAFAYEGSFDSELIDDACSRTHKSICEIFSGPCDVTTFGDYLESGTRCFYIDQIPRTWYAARLFCESKGGKLLILDSDSTRTYLRDNLARWFGDEILWIGMIGTEWEWLSDADFSWTNWEADLQYTKDHSNCMVMRNSAWGVSLCDSTTVKGQLCLYEEIHPTTEAATTTEGAVTTDVMNTTENSTTETTTESNTTDAGNNTAENVTAGLTTEEMQTTEADVNATQNTATVTTEVDATVTSTEETPAQSTVPETANADATTVDTTEPADTATNPDDATTMDAAETTQATTTSGSGAGAQPSAGQSTGGSSGLTTIEIVLIVMVIIVVIVLLIIILVFCLKKKKDNNRNAVAAGSPYADERDKAGYPNDDPIYVPPSEAADTLTYSAGNGYDPPPKKLNDFDSMTRIIIQ